MKYILLLLVGWGISAEAAFLDVYKSHPYREAINFAQQAGIVKGYDDGTFRPYKKINRAEFVKIVVVSQWGEDATRSCNIEASKLNDVKSSDWFVPYVCLAQTKNLVSGYDDGTFRATQPVLFTEAAKILTKSFEIKGNQSAIWYKPYVEYLVEQKAVPVSIPALDSAINRGEMAEMIFRLRNKRTDKLSQRYSDLTGETEPTTEVKVTPETRQTEFSDIGLQTNTAISSIPLTEVLSGGPEKDGIPALKNPSKWDDVGAARNWLKDDHLGVLYEYQGTKRFYPFDTLYWHEIVNDQIGDHAYAVTFCPLCGSVLTFNRDFEGKRYTFGVSGKLWESNLLMYDTSTESLWSQIKGEAVVGDLTGKKLALLPSQVMSFAELKVAHPKTQVMTNETGYRRPYGSSPYGSYETSDDLMFGVKNLDKSVPPKTIFYIVPVPEGRVGWNFVALKKAGEASVELSGKTYTAIYNPDSTITVRSATNQNLPGYFSMWFSWQTHQNEAKAAWLK